jgi:HIV Tat-specific factor 1
MFTLRELEEDASLLLDLKEDVREECATLGDVTNVVLYDVRMRTFLFNDCLFVTAEGTGRYHDG